MALGRRMLTKEEEGSRNYCCPVEGPGPRYVAYVIVFLGSIICNYAVIWRFDGTCG